MHVSVYPHPRSWLPLTAETGSRYGPIRSALFEMDFNRLDQFARHEGGISRRLFTSYLAALSSVPWLGLHAEDKGTKASKFSTNPFTLGVASGDPNHEGMVLWTKLAPKPLEVNGGMPLDAFTEVTWEVARDEGMSEIVQSGMTLATPHLGHTLHVETHGLDSDRWYYYRFPGW